MAQIEHRYMTVSVDIQPEGLNLSVWFSTAEFFASERTTFPFTYTHMGDACTWLIHANMELTIKVCAVVTEYADRICAENIERNKKRKVVNL